MSCPPAFWLFETTFLCRSSCPVAPPCLRSSKLGCPMWERICFVVLTSSYWRSLIIFWLAGWKNLSIGAIESNKDILEHDCLAGKLAASCCIKCTLLVLQFRLKVFRARVWVPLATVGWQGTCKQVRDVPDMSCGKETCNIEPHLDISKPINFGKCTSDAPCTNYSWLWVRFDYIYICAH